MADLPVHKPAGPHEKAPSAEDFDRLAALIKPSWELDDAPFSMGNRSLSPQEWEQLGVDSSQSSPAPQPSAKDGRNGAAGAHALDGSASNGGTGHGGASASEAISADLTIPMSAPDMTVPMAKRVSAPPAPQPRASAPPVFPAAHPASGSTPHARTLTPRSDIAVAVDASAREWQKTSLSDELSSYPHEKSRKGLYVGIAAAAVVILAGVFFATRSADTETPPTSPGAASPTDEKGPSVSNARVDIPPIPSAAATPATPATQTAQPPHTAQAAPAAAPAAKEQPVAKEAKESSPAKEVKEPPAPREHVRTAPSPRTQAPATHNNGAPAAQPATPKASNKNNASGGIVRDVPF